MTKNSCNSQIDRIFNEIKEIGIRDSNYDNVKDNENVYLFQPGFVSLLKSKFSNFDNKEALKTRVGRGSDRYLKDITHHEVEINKEEIPCKNIVSDTRRVFECIAPKDSQYEDIGNDRGTSFENVLVKSKTHILETNQVVKSTSFPNEEMFGERYIGISEAAVKLKVVTHNTNNTKKHTLEVEPINKLNNNVTIEKNCNDKEVKSTNVPMKLKVISNDFRGSRSLITKINHINQSCLPLNEKISNGDENDGNNTNSSKNQTSDTKQLSESNLIQSEKICNNNVINVNYVPVQLDSIKNDMNSTKMATSEIIKILKPTVCQSNTNSHNKGRLKVGNRLTNESRSFIFNASDFANTEPKTDTLLNSECYEFLPITTDNLSLKSILKDNSDKKRTKTSRNITFASNNLLISVHVYEREYPAIEEEKVSNFIYGLSDTTENNRSDYNLTSPQSGGTNAGSSIYSKTSDDDVMNFQSDMLF